MRNIAVIPARSGSKGLKDKNIMKLNNIPLMAYSIESALESNMFETIHVSTDSEKYAEIARTYGAEVPFLRSKELASDTASTWDAMRFTVTEYEKQNKKFDTITVLQPTSPLRTSEDIISAFQFFEQKKANMISTVCEMEHSPLWCNTLPDDLSMKNFEKESVAFLPRQKLPTYYRENGAIYILKISSLFSFNNIYQDNCYAYIMKSSHSIDIDTEIDFVIAQAIMEAGFHEK